MASHPTVNLAHCAEAETYDPVGQLKVSVNKLAVAIQKIGNVLGAAELGASTSVMNDGETKAVANNLAQGVKELQIVGNTSQPTEKTKEAKQKAKDGENSPINSDLQPKTAEEIRAQRANKVAEKKARAEMAAAKKAAVVANAARHQEKSKATNSQPVSTTSQVTPSNIALIHHKQNIPAAKSALRVNSKYQTAGEVKFDLSNNIVKSTSEESVSSDVPPLRCSDPPAPPSTAHIHPAFINLCVRCEQSIIDEIDTLCLSFIAAFKEYLSDWTSQRQKEDRDPSSIGHDLDIAIRPQIAHLTQEGRWPLPGPLGNIVRQLKKEILKLGTVVRNGHVQTIEDISKWLIDCEEENFSSAYRAISDYLLGIK